MTLYFFNLKDTIHRAHSRITVCLLQCMLPTKTWRAMFISRGAKSPLASLVKHSNSALKLSKYKETLTMRSPLRLKMQGKLADILSTQSIHSVLRVRRPSYIERSNTSIGLHQIG